MPDLLCLDDASYVLNALTPAERREFEWHLARCTLCQLSVRQLATVPWLLALTGVRAIDDPAGP